MALSEDEELELLELEEAEHQANKGTPHRSESGVVSPLVGAAIGGGLIEGARRATEATSSKLKDFASDAEFRAMGGHSTPAGQDILAQNAIDEMDVAPRDIGRASLDRGGMGIKTAAGYRKNLIGGGDVDRDSIAMKILEQKALREAKSGPMFNPFRPIESAEKMAGQRGMGALAKGLDVAGDVTSKAAGKIARKLPLIGAGIGGLLGYEAARADGASPPDAAISAAGGALSSLDPTGLTDATPTGPARGSPEEMLESGDRAGYVIARAPEKFQRALRSAADKGEASLATTHRILMKQDPDYRAAFEGEGP